MEKQGVCQKIKKQYKQEQHTQSKTIKIRREQHKHQSYYVPDIKKYNYKKSTTTQRAVNECSHLMKKTNPVNNEQNRLLFKNNLYDIYI